MPVKLKDLAARVGKSITTVSRALADYDDVSPVTKEAVRQAARALGYRPNVTARQLQGQRTDTVMLLLPPSQGSRASDSFLGDFVAGISAEATARGLGLLLFTQGDGDDEADTYLEHIRSCRVDGFLVARVRQQDRRISMLQAEQVPFAAFGRQKTANDFPLVDIDNELGMRRAVDHLVRLGHRRIACITEPQGLTRSLHRRQGFSAAMKAHRLAVKRGEIVEGDFSKESGYQVAQELLSRPGRPTAIAACNDLMAVGALAAAGDLGLAVGQDVSVTGFGNSVFGEYSHPSLTTLHNPAHEIGRTLCRMLAQIIVGERLKSKQVILKPKLVVRKSTGPASPA